MQEQSTLATRLAQHELNLHYFDLERKRLRYRSMIPVRYFLDTRTGHRFQVVAVLPGSATTIGGRYRATGITEAGKDSAQRWVNRLTDILEGTDW